MHITNNTGLPKPLYDMVKEDRYDNGGADASVTELLLPPRIRILEKENAEFIVKDASAMMQTALGTVLHEAMASDGTEGVICEERLSVTVNGWKVSGGIDRQITNEDGTVTIEDFKVTSAGKVQRVMGSPKDSDWAEQLNMYARLVEVNKKVRVSSLRIIAMIRDWSAIKSSFIGGYPKAPVVKVDIPLMSRTKRASLMRSLVIKHQRAENAFAFSGRLPECDKDEMWTADSKNERAFRGVAIDKETRERKVVCRANKDEDLVYDFVKRIKDDDYYTDFRVELVMPERIRCKHYCDAAPFCDQLADHEIEKNAYEAFSYLRIHSMRDENG